MAYKYRKQHDTYNGGCLGRSALNYSSASGLGSSYNIESSLKCIRRDIISEQRLYSSYSNHYYSISNNYDTGYDYDNSYNNNLYRRYNSYQ